MRYVTLAFALVALTTTPALAEHQHCITLREQGDMKTYAACEDVADFADSIRHLPADNSGRSIEEFNAREDASRAVEAIRRDYRLRQSGVLPIPRYRGY